MLLEKAWQNYKELNKAFSDNARKLAFAVVAICWFFRIERNTGAGTAIDFPALITISLFFTILFVLFDLSQYLIQTLMMRNWIQHEENRLKKQKNFQVLKGDTNIKMPKKLYYPALKLLYLKVVALYFSSLFLLAHFIKMLLP